jgi:hypothetical protein
MEKLSLTDRVRNEEALHRGKEERKILQTIQSKANWIGHILRWNCLLTRYRRKERNDGKTRKKTKAATG